MGAIAALFSVNLGDKTRRGLQGRALAGKSAGGKCFGYETIRQFNQKGEVIDEERRIIPEEAQIVHRIFQDYLQGNITRKIAAELNAEGIESPTRQRLGANNNQWQPPSRDRHSQITKLLCRTDDLEPTSVIEGSDYAEARFEAQS